MGDLLKENKVQKKAYQNYKNNSPWPSNDDWHDNTHMIIDGFVKNWIKKHTYPDSICLNIGSGKTKYSVKGTLMQMDIVSEYIENESNYIVGSLEDIPLEDNSVEFIICVGSVLNYCDAIRSISEIKRVLKPNGKGILEFERSNSAEFLFNHNYASSVFLKRYNYNNQEHLLWMYSEKYIKKILNYNDLKIENIYRFHTLSSLIYRLGWSEKKASKYSKFDNYLRLFSYPFAHNVIIEFTK